ncbi:tyrosyl-DNA phosphodiesterase [Mollisia scopiformis]|uniref:Tyrosyl-DNA phosphodiesterase n=1 Tax=Mollisia scopiformis TaxID=149040 RepID=A0A194X9F1_MOLSC|nr:tyrosyl-DNA phosphodiesterase [Mollisia scopiformis]KUJ16796.1 tyrosyl-DNA phosphodiesterase [Mollisia scopiformis]
MEDSEERSRKRPRLSNDEDVTTSPSTLPRTLTSAISPPPLRRNRKVEIPESKVLKSPFQLTWIRDLPESSNVDAVSLKDILGDPMIAECWEFNYLHNLDFLMDAFDTDVRDLVKVHVVHGFWKSEDPQRQRIKLQAEKYPNVSLHTAYMPEMFGTHHTKMLMLLRHDDTAQVIIHTANMIEFDWTNMAQALWKSPLLPKMSSDASEPPESPPMGSGEKFKLDFLNYLRAYDGKRTICKPIIEKLLQYDFSEIRAALVGSVPGKQGIETDSKTLWGWAGLKEALKSVPVTEPETEPEIVAQISSIATLGPNDKWLDKTLFKALSTSKNVISSKPSFKVIFPTADEIRRSLNGYASGSAIHTKIQSAQQQKQLQYLKPLFCHWAGDGGSTPPPTHDAGRKRAAPHIKTYTRFTDSTRTAIDWMLVTSANLSKQAWGEATNSAGDIRICSYELGVLVWPALFGEKSTMVPTFKSDTPTVDAENSGTELIVGARMPYDFPLVPYGKDDEPWCATASYTEPDWKGETWKVE